MKTTHRWRWNGVHEAQGFANHSLSAPSLLTKTYTLSWLEFFGIIIELRCLGSLKKRDSAGLVCRN